MESHRWTASEILIDKDVSCRWGTVNRVKLETQMMETPNRKHWLRTCMIIDDRR